jgi:phosphate transport system permease protein
MTRMRGPRRDVSGTVGRALLGGALALDLLLVAGLLALLATHGLAHFAQPELRLLTLRSGERVLAEVHDVETTRSGREQLRVRVGNRDVYGLDFRRVDVADIDADTAPQDAVLLERREWGRFIGFVDRLTEAGRDGDPGGTERVLSAQSSALWATLDALIETKAAQRDALERLAQDEPRPLDAALAAAARAASTGGEARPEYVAELSARHANVRERLGALEAALVRDTLWMRTADAREVAVRVSDVVRAVRPNQLGIGGSVALYLSRVHELLLDAPRESNTEGGIFPAIFGTVLMVFLTSLAVAPLGVLAALYLREYARGGVAVRTVRIAVNSLAGVPSIVFGVFGLGFFVYGVGGTIDALLFADRLPAPTFGTGGILWASLTLALLTVPVVVVSTEEGLAAVPRIVREGSLALGATRFETLRRVVVPAAVPGILTGLILAMARAAGEVAPLMIVGMVKLAPSLPIDGEFPYLHLERKFMHLGFHIYDVGFQSPNVEAARPLVFATALLLVVIVLITNLSAILLRNHLRGRYATSAV